MQVKCKAAQQENDTLRHLKNDLQYAMTELKKKFPYEKDSLFQENETLQTKLDQANKSLREFRKLEQNCFQMEQSNVSALILEIFGAEEKVSKYRKKCETTEHGTHGTRPRAPKGFPKLQRL